MACCIIIAMILAGCLALLRAVCPNMVQPAGAALAWRPRPNVQALSKPPKASRAQSQFSWRARGKSVSFALAGLGFVIRSEHNAWIHIGVTLTVLALGVFLDIDPQDWLWLLVAICWVWFAETMNTAFEHLCDVVAPEKNESVRVAKDVAAGAVLISALMAVAIGAVILLPYFKAYI